MGLIGRGQPLPRPLVTGRGAQLALGGLAGVVVGAAAAAGSGSMRGPMLTLLVLTGACALTVVGDVRRILLGVVLLDVPFQWDVNLGYDAALARMAALGGWNISLTTVAVTCLYLVWIGQLLVRAEGAAQPRFRAAAIPIALLASLAVSLAVARDRTAGGFEVALIAQMLMLFVYVASNVRSRRDVRFVVVLLLGGLLLESMLALAGYVSGATIHVPGTAVVHQTVSDPIGSRLVGTFAAPNTAGAYFAFMLALSLSLCLSPVGWRLRHLAVLASVPAGICLALTLSRGAWIAFVVSVLVLMLGVRGQRASRFSPRAMIAIAVCAVALLVPLQGVISGRLNGNDAGAAASRVPLLHIATLIIEDHPLLGVGANNFAVVLPDYAGPEFSADWLAIVHNKYLLMWSEAGLAGLIALLAFLWTTIARGWRARRGDDALLAAAALGLAAAVAGHAVHMNFDTFQSRPMTETLWLGAALLASPAFASRARAGGNG
jgi:hypothetical protein